VVCDLPPTRGSQKAEAEKPDDNATKKSRALTKQKGSERAALGRRRKAAKSVETKRKGRRTSRDKRRLASALEARAEEITVETNMQASAAETKVETHVATTSLAQKPRFEHESMRQGHRPS
jgi:hypothetical protein